MNSDTEVYSVSPFWHFCLMLLPIVSLALAIGIVFLLIYLCLHVFGRPGQNHPQCSRTDSEQAP